MNLAKNLYNFVFLLYHERKERCLEKSNERE